jgi:hypothetical protein
MLKRTIAGLTIAASLAACSPHVAFALSKKDQARFADRVFRVPVPGHDPMIFGLNDCIAYKAKTAHTDIVGWSVVLASDWGQHSYPKWLTSCTSQHIKYEVNTSWWIFALKRSVPAAVARAATARTAAARGMRKAGKSKPIKVGRVFHKTSSHREICARFRASDSR